MPRQYLTSRSFAALKLVLMALAAWFLWLCSKESITGLLEVHFKTKVNRTVYSTDSEAQDLFARAEQRQKMRKKQLKDYCQQHSYKRLPWDRKRMLDKFLIDDKNKFIYCTVPKVATTPLKMTLMRLRNDSGLKITGATAHNPKYWRHMSEYNEKELSPRLATYFKFLFVREPFHRLLSGYKDKFFGPRRFYTNGFRAMIVKAFRPQESQAISTKTNDVTFTEFLEYIVSYSNAWSHNAHWRQVEHICFPCAFEFDLIGHFETLEEDVAYFLKKAEFDDRVTFPPVPSSTTTDSKFTEYYAQVPREIIYRVAEAFRGDFEMFGYPFPGPLKSLLGDHA